MKKIVSLMMTACLIFLLSVPALAVSNEGISQVNNKEELFNMLNFIEPQKNSYGLESVDFADLRIGNIIHCYEYADGGFQEMPGFYPLFSESSLIALAVSPDGEHFQFMTAFTKEISAANSSNIAIIYDAQGCYLYNGTTFVLLAEGCEECNSREVLPGTESIEDVNVDVIGGLDEIVLTDLSLSEPLGYISHAKERIQTLYYCNVKYVPQGYSNICWAASVACISNYLKGTNLTAKDVALEYWNAKASEVDKFNQPAAPLIVANHMNTIYHLGYSYSRKPISHGVICDNIYNNYPVFANFVGNYGHAVVIWGIDEIHGYIQIMDPLNGMISFYYGNPISYTFPSTGVVHTLYETVSHIK